MTKLIYAITMNLSKKALIKKYGVKFWNRFKTIADSYLPKIIDSTPDIGKSIFAFNYKFGPCYIAWYKAFTELGITNADIDNTIWLMSERMMSVLPKPLLRWSGKIYLDGFRKNAARHVEKQKKGTLHPYDWKINYREIDKNTFEIDITECALLRLAEAHDARGVLPGICRIDHLLSHLMGNGFERTKTLGDDNDCCNCRFSVVGSCEWSPEKGFEYRK